MANLNDAFDLAFRRVMAVFEDRTLDPPSDPPTMICRACEGHGFVASDSCSACDGYGEVLADSY